MKSKWNHRALTRRRFFPIGEFMQGLVSNEPQVSLICHNWHAPVVHLFSRLVLEQPPLWAQFIGRHSKWYGLKIDLSLKIHPSYARQSGWQFDLWKDGLEIKSCPARS